MFSLVIKNRFSLLLFTFSCSVFLMIIGPAVSFSSSSSSSSRRRNTSFSLSSSDNANPNNNIFALNVQLIVKPEYRNDFLTIIEADKKKTMENEKDSLQFVIGEDLDTPNVFYLHEQYKTKEGFDTHTQTEHYKEWKEFCTTKQPFVTDPIVNFYTLQNSANTNQEKQQTPTTTEQETKTVCLNVELCIQETVREEFLKVIYNNQLGSRTKEPLCLQYEFGECMDKKNVFYFHEEYLGKEGLEAHLSAPHFDVWEQFASTGTPFTKPPVVQKYVSYF